MPPSPDKASQLAPSQFAYFKTVEPTTTASGVIPGRAPLDTPQPNHSPSPPLERSQRSQKPTARKVEGEETQVRPSASKPHGKQHAQPSAIKKYGKKAQHTSNIGPSKPTVTVESQAGSTKMASSSGAGVNETETQHENQGDYEGEGEEDEYEYQTLPIDPTIAEQLEALLGHDIEHLSESQVKDLLEKMCETQVLAMDTEVQPITTIVQSFVRSGQASRNHDGSPSYEGSGERSPLQAAQTLASDKDSMSTQKRHLDALPASRVLKRARLAPATESESDTDTRCSLTSDSDSEREVPLLLNPRGAASTSAPNLPQPPLANQVSTMPANPPTHPPARLFACPLARPPTPAKIFATNTSTTDTAASMSTANISTTFLLRYPLPADLNNSEALANWALRISKDQAQEPNRNSGLSYPGASRLQQADNLATTTTTSHFAQTVAEHRAERAAAQHLGSQLDVGAPSQTGTINATTLLASTPTPTTAMETVISSSKKKYRKKTKLSDLPGRVGEIGSAAIPYFLSTVFAEGGYENLETFQDWALDAYRRMWDLEYTEEEHEYEPPPVAVLKIMTRRVSWLRGEIKRRVRAVVEYGYGFRNPAVSRIDTKHNRHLAKRLKPQVFHCKNLVSNTDQFEHTQFIRAISAGLFWDSDSLGVTFRDRFDPVPIPAVALIQACIEEWKGGRYKAIALDIDTQKLVYESHLLSLYSYENVAASRLARFRAQWASTGLNYSGTTFDEDPTVIKPYILAQNVRPDTPPLEIEVDE